MQSEIQGKQGYCYRLVEFIDYPFSTAQVLRLHEIANEPDIRILADDKTLHITVQEIRALIAQAREGRAEEEVFYYILENTTSRLPAGVFGLTRIDDSVLETGFWISKTDRGTGSQALKQLMDAWKESGCQIIAKTAKSNLAAVKILESAGFCLTKTDSGMLHFIKDFNNSPPEKT